MNLGTSFLTIDSAGVGIGILSIAVPFVGLVTALVSLIRALSEKRSRETKGSPIIVTEYERVPKVKVEGEKGRRTFSTLVAGIYFAMTCLAYLILYGLIVYGWFFREGFVFGTDPADKVMVGLGLFYIPVSLFYAFAHLRMYRVMSKSPAEGPTVAHALNAITVKGEFDKLLDEAVKVMRRLGWRVVELKAGEEGWVRAVKYYRNNQAPFDELYVLVTRGEGDTNRLRVMSDGVRISFKSDYARNERNVERFISELIG